VPARDIHQQATTPSGAVVAPAAPLARRWVGRYELRAQLARGGMATVYLARRDGRDVALKELTLDPDGDPALAERFALEARVAAALRHPNVVRVLESFRSGGRSYIAMEHVEGGSLRAHRGRLAVEQVAGALADVLAALDHIEQRGIVHRDIKPENLLVAADGRVKLADFGVAKACGVAPARLTADGRTVGTPSYMAPEQAMGHEVGPWTDLYSLGVVAYELLVGELPFKNTDWSVLIQHIHQPVPAPRALRPDLDPALERWLLRLLEKQPEARFASAREALDELERCMAALRGPGWRHAARLAPVAGAAVVAVPAAQPPAAPRRRVRALERRRGDCMSCGCRGPKAA
jgi:serine/threonine protein kinase